MFNCRVIVNSNFRPSDAHRAFPCFDEPEYKATFGVTILREPEYSTVSTMNILAQEGRYMITYKQPNSSSCTLLSFPKPKLD